MSATVGWLLLVAPFCAYFAFMARSIGFRAATIIYLVIISSIGSMVIGSMLIQGVAQ